MREIKVTYHLSKEQEKKFEEAAGMIEEKSGRPVNREEVFESLMMMNALSQIDQKLDYYHATAVAMPDRKTMELIAELGIDPRTCKVMVKGDDVILVDRATGRSRSLSVKEA